MLDEFHQICHQLSYTVYNKIYISLNYSEYNMQRATTSFLAAAMIPFKIIVSKIPVLKPLVKGGRAVVRNYRDEVSRQRDVKKYAGNNVECPFCKKTFSGFRPSGVLKRVFWNTKEGAELLKNEDICVANAQCPNCRSSERHRLMWFYLNEKKGDLLKNGSKILDVAPDPFILDVFLNNPQIDYTSIDIENYCKPTYIMDLTNLTFEDNTFDFIICSHVLEHIEDDLRGSKRTVPRFEAIRGRQLFRCPYGL